MPFMTKQQQLHLRLKHFERFVRALEQRPRTSVEQTRDLYLEDLAEDVFHQSLGHDWEHALGEDSAKVQVNVGLAGNRVQVFLSDAEGSMASTIRLTRAYGQPRFEPLYGDGPRSIAEFAERTGASAERLRDGARALAGAHYDSSAAVRDFPPLSRAKRKAARRSDRGSQTMHGPPGPNMGPGSGPGGPSMR